MNVSMCVHNEPLRSEVFKSKSLTVTTTDSGYKYLTATIRLEELVINVFSKTVSAEEFEEFESEKWEAYDNENTYDLRPSELKIMARGI